MYINKCSDATYLTSLNFVDLFGVMVASLEWRQLAAVPVAALACRSARRVAHCSRVDVVASGERTVLDGVRVGTGGVALGTLVRGQDRTDDALLVVLQVVVGVDLLVLAVVLAEGAHHLLLGPLRPRLLAALQNRDQPLASLGSGLVREQHLTESTSLSLR